jgi:hypothetical protein
MKPEEGEKEKKRDEAINHQPDPNPTVKPRAY